MTDRVTIINGNDGDDTVMINGRTLHFLVDSLLPDSDLWALQWYGESGEAEYKSKPTEQVSSLDDYQAVIDEFNRLAAIEDAPPEPPTLDESKFIKLFEINHAADSALSVITNAYPESERLSWDKQEQEARAWLADDTALTPLIDSMVSARGVEKTDQVQRIIANADSFAQQSGLVFGKRQHFVDQLNAANTVADVDLIVVDFG